MKQTHLRAQRRGRVPIAACGVRNPEQHTTDPAEVTCGKCKRTLLMADTEARQSFLSKQRRFPSRKQKEQP